MQASPQARFRFEEATKAALADLLAINKTRVVITSLAPGSIVVTFWIIASTGEQDAGLGFCVQKFFYAQKVQLWTLNTDKSAL